MTTDEKKQIALVVGGGATILGVLANAKYGTEIFIIGSALTYLASVICENLAKNK